jgi:hypothetical protein
VAKVAKRADVSLAEKLQGDEGESLLFRLKKTVTNLRQKRDYNDSVSVSTAAEALRFGILSHGRGCDGHT